MPPPSYDLRSRRMALGASEELIAAGMGLTLVEIRAIERGDATDDQLDSYAALLARIEGWSAEEREVQYLFARMGRRFANRLDKRPNDK